VVDAAVESTSVPDGMLNQCVVEVVRGLGFPKRLGAGAALVRYPFSLAGGSGDAVEGRPLMLPPNLARLAST
jgi:hypothetical protein